MDNLRLGESLLDLLLGLCNEVGPNSAGSIVVEHEVRLLHPISEITQCSNAANASTKARPQASSGSFSGL